jgi:diketogulonate reductase-like aldo/keto reductase
MHWPVAFGRSPDGQVVKTPKDSKGKVIIDQKLTEDPLPTWKAMEKLVDSGKVKSIGVSNFNIRRCQELMKGVSDGILP